MESIQKATSGAETDASGSVESDELSKGASTRGGESSETYPAEFVKKMKQEKLNQAKQIKELTQKLEALEGDRAKEIEDKLAKKEQFKTLWEQEKEKRERLEQDFSGLRTQITEGKKKDALREQLLRLGLNPTHEDTAFRLMDTSSVVVDEDTGSFIGVEETAKDFYEKFKTIGIFGQKSPGVSHKAPVLGKSVSKPLSEMSSKELQEEIKKTYS